MRKRLQSLRQWNLASKLVKSNRTLVSGCLFFILLFVPFIQGAAQTLQPIPDLTDRVIDTTGSLAPSDIKTLTAQLHDLELKKGSQVVVLLVRTTQPEAIEQFSLRVVENWKLGRKGVDDGALLLLAMEDRAMRLEVGYGLEGVLNDAASKRILDDTLRPYLRNNELSAGLHAAVNTIVALIMGEPLPPVPIQQRSSQSWNGPDMETTIFLLVFFGMFISSQLVKYLGRTGAGLVSAVIVFVAGNIVTVLIPAAIAAVIVFFMFSMNGSGFSVGGRGGGGWSGGGGGGGFSGGGGSFGGGGASGRW